MIIKKLELGDKVEKSYECSYIIDDVNIDKQLGNFPEGTFPYGPINRKLKSAHRKILELFEDSDEVLFSKAYELGIGECLEKAVLTQLHVQKKEGGFLIIGCFAEEDGYVERHAYNVIFKNGKPFLVDTHNPLQRDSQGNITHPYIAPLIEIEGGELKFKVPNEWKQGRIYSVF
jgi:hypothetical protein